MKGSIMGIVTHLILSVIHLFFVATDILFLLLLMRMLSYRWQHHWLMAFNSVGEPVVDWFTGFIERGLTHFSKKTFSQRMVLFIAMLTISFLRIFIVALFSQ